MTDRTNTDATDIMPIVFRNQLRLAPLIRLRIRGADMTDGVSCSNEGGNLSVKGCGLRQARVSRPCGVGEVEGPPNLLATVPFGNRGSPQLLGSSPVYLRATPIRDIVLLLMLLRVGPALSVKYDIYDRLSLVQ